MNKDFLKYKNEQIEKIKHRVEAHAPQCPTRYDREKSCKCGGIEVKTLDEQVVELGVIKFSDPDDIPTSTPSSVGLEGNGTQDQLIKALEDIVKALKALQMTVEKLVVSKNSWEDKCD